jgi:hypothetical protein
MSPEKKSNLKPLKHLIRWSLAMFSVIYFAQCKIVVETFEDSVGDNYFADYQTSKLVDLVMDYSRVLHGMENIDMKIPIADLDTSNKNQKWFIVHFGQDTYYTCADGIDRRNPITVNWSGDFFKQGNTFKITMEPTYMGYYKFTGFIDVTFWGENEYEQNVHEIKSTVEIIQDNPRADIYDWTNEYVRTRIIGGLTPRSSDDIYSVWGSSYARNRKGRYYTSVIKDTIHFSNECEWGILNGRIDIQPVDATQRTFVNYGSWDQLDCRRYYSFSRGNRDVTITKNTK